MLLLMLIIKMVDELKDAEQKISRGVGKYLYEQSSQNMTERIVKSYVESGFNTF